MSDFKVKPHEMVVSAGRVDSLLRWWEVAARGKLKKDGYPVELGELLTVLDAGGDHPMEITEIAVMLQHFRQVRTWLNRGNAELAAWNMALAIQNATKALNIRPAFPLMQKGTKYSKKQKEARAKRKTWGGLTQDHLLERNQKMIEHFKRTHLSRSGFANKHAAKYGLKSRQVMEILKMAVCSLPG